MKFSKNAKEFYEDHNLTENRFRELLGVATQSLRKYFDGTLKCRETILKIEIGIDLVEDYKMWFPDKFSVPGTHEYMGVHEIELYDKFFKTLYYKALLAEL